MRASGSSTSSATRWRSTRPPPLPSVRSSPSSRPSGSGRGATRASRSPTRRSGRPSPQALPTGSALIEQYGQRTRHTVNGWRIDTSGGQYGQDYLRRALVAQSAGVRTCPRRPSTPGPRSPAPGATSTTYALPHPLRPRSAATRRRLLVAHALRARRLLHRQLPRPLRHRRPHPGPHPEPRRLARPLRAAHRAGREAGQLAACPDRPVQPHDAAVPAEALGARRHLAPSGGHANSVTVRVSTTRWGRPSGSRRCGRSLRGSASRRAPCSRSRGAREGCRAPPAPSGRCTTRA